MGYNAITVQGLKIAFLEKNRSASKTLFFVHGNSCSANFWRKQIQSKLFSDYRIIAFDLPGHGESSMPALHDCTIVGVAAIMSEAVRKLSNGNPYILIGGSLGSNIVVEMLYDSAIPQGIVLVGPCILGEGFSLDNMVKKGTHVHVVFTADPPEDEIIKYAQETSLSDDSLDLSAFINDFKKANKLFRATLSQHLNIHRDEVDVLNQQKFKCLIVFGADEKIINEGYLDKATIPLWGDSIFKISGASHLVHIDRPDKFNALMADYCAAVLR